MARTTASVSGSGGIRLEDFTIEARARLFNAADQRSMVALRPGTRASNILYLPSDVVDGDTILFGADTAEVDIVNTDSGVNTHATTGALNDTDQYSLLILTAAPATAINVGDVARIENEMVLVVRKISTTQYIVVRAYAGTTIATHAANTDVYVSNSVPTNISVPLVTTLTPAAFAIAYTAVFNFRMPNDQESRPARTPTLYGSFTAYSLGTKGQVLITKNTTGVDATATTETFNAAGNVWSSATMAGGVAAAIVSYEVAARVPTAAEVLAGEMHFAFPFTVRTAFVKMYVTATGQPVAFNGQVLKGYAETTTEVLPGTIVTVKNTGPASTAYITEFAATHTVEVYATE
jgi:hypothetical protein